MRFLKPGKTSSLVLGLCAVVSLCGCGSSIDLNLDFGGLRIDTITTGANLDPNAYSIRVTGPSLDVEQTIGLNDQVIFSVTPGAYSSVLSDIADNCTVDVNPFDVIVTTGVTARVTFNINCV